MEDPITWKSILEKFHDQYFLNFVCQQMEVKFVTPTKDTKMVAVMTLLSQAFSCYSSLLIELNNLFSPLSSIVSMASLGSHAQKRLVSWVILAPQKACYVLTKES